MERTKLCEVMSCQKSKHPTVRFLDGPCLLLLSLSRT